MPKAMVNYFLCFLCILCGGNIHVSAGCEVILLRINGPYKSVELMIQSIAILIFLYATAWFLLSIWLKRNDIADIAWGLGYLLVCLFLVFTRETSTIAWIVYGLVAVWALRLSGHIYLRNRKKTEDFRYRQWREDWGKNWVLRSYLQVYLLQGFFMLILSAPILIAGYSGIDQTGILTWTGLAVWITGFFFQSVGDYQLAQFVKTRKNKDEILQTGLWRYSRHPNYFGEILIWWGIFLVVLPLENGWWGIVSPLTITYLLVYVSGAPMMEKRYAGNAAYEAYKKRTSMLIPWRSLTR